jgi:hypothetical protein
VYTGSLLISTHGHIAGTSREPKRTNGLVHVIEPTTTIKNPATSSCRTLYGSQCQENERSSVSNSPYYCRWYCYGYGHVISQSVPLSWAVQYSVSSSSSNRSTVSIVILLVL